MTRLEDAVSDVAQDAAQQVVLRHLKAAEDKGRPSQLRSVIRAVVQEEINMRLKPLVSPGISATSGGGGGANAGLATGGILKSADPPKKVWKVTCFSPYPNSGAPLTHRFHSYADALEHVRVNPVFDHQIEVPK